MLAIPAAPALAEGRAEANAVEYHSLDQLRTLAAQGPTIVWFHADWCPVCHATMVSLRARWPEIPPELNLVIADYDQEAELKARYGITYQNTYVQVGRDAEQLQVWNGGGVDGLIDKPRQQY